MSSDERIRDPDDAPATTARDDEVRAQEAERDEGTIVGRTATIAKPREEIYAFWRHFPNLAGVMENI